MYIGEQIVKDQKAKYNGSQKVFKRWKKKLEDLLLNSQVFFV